MVTVAQRLAALGIALPPPAAPLALYRAATRAGALVYVSGQLATRDGKVLHPGRLGAGVSMEQGREAARAAALNALAAAQALLGSLDGVRVVRLTGYVACEPGFTEQPQVLNGASELLRDALGEEAGVGARVAIGVVALPAGSPVELDLILDVGA
ncbi:MAG: RidA family protein [Dehalococcoidia bacterium]|nr:RidA family protein [Dehalococcoidia bacterium]